MTDCTRLSGLARIMHGGGEDMVEVAAADGERICMLIPSHLMTKQKETWGLMKTELPSVPPIRDALLRTQRDVGMFEMRAHEPTLECYVWS